MKDHSDVVFEYLVEHCGCTCYYVGYKCEYIVDSSGTEVCRYCDSGGW